MKNVETAKRLSEALARASMSQQELADKSGVGKASISQYMNGTHAPGNKKAAQIAEVLNVNPLWLMGFDVPYEPDYTVDDLLVETIRAMSDSEREEVREYVKFILSKRK